MYDKGTQERFTDTIYFIVAHDRDLLFLDVTIFNITLIQNIQETLIIFQLISMMNFNFNGYVNCLNIWRFIFKIKYYS